MSVGGRGGPQGLLEMDERERLPRSHFYKISSFPRGLAQLCGLPAPSLSSSLPIPGKLPTPLLSSRLSAHCIGPLFHQNHFGRDESPQSASGEACFVPQFGHPPSLPLGSVLFGLGMDQHGRKFALFIPRAHSPVPCLTAQLSPSSLHYWMDVFLSSAAQLQFQLVE